ncbi:MAG: HNH endonuclease [Alphaproteobacteria bacterium]
MSKEKSKQVEKLLSIKYLLERYEFHFETGEIFLKSNGNRADKIHHFRSDSNTRYRQVQVPDPSDKTAPWVKISAHRMIWAVAHERWPLDGMDIDHRDSDPMNNAITNLEEVTEVENILRGHRKKPLTTPNDKINDDTSLIMLRHYADDGNPKAQYRLGLYYQKLNRLEASHWFNHVLANRDADDDMRKDAALRLSKLYD